MRVRQWAVVGAALVAAWAGGTGVAQANGDTGTVPGCVAPTSSGSSSAASPTTDPCSVKVWVAAGGDCADPETLSVFIDATGLEPNAEYTLAVGSDDFTPPSGPNSAKPAFEFDFTTDADGAYRHVFDATENASVQYPSGAFTLAFEVVDSAWNETAYGQFTVDTCQAIPPASPTTTTSAPTTTETATTTNAAAAATTSAAPVAVTPAAAHATQLLANTGAPVAGVALVGGVLLVAGTGALVATRRRAS